jgi:hypothetical protein
MEKVIFAGPQITQLFQEQDCSTQLNSTERRVWKVSEDVCRNSLSNEKKENYSEFVKQLISSYSAIGCNMLWKLRILLLYSNFFVLKIRAPSRRNMAKCSISTFRKWKRGTVGCILLQSYRRDMKWRI